MSNVWKIDMVQNYTTKDDFTKLTFKKGDSFSAKVLRLEGSATDVMIKLIDGRVFPAKVEEGVLKEQLDDYLFKFQMQGFEGGKLLLNILESNFIEKSESGEGSNLKDPLMNELLKNLDFTVKKEDIQILKAMLKNNIPITESNLLEIKGLNELINRANNSSEKIDEFINKFIEGKGIDSNSSQGELIKSTLGKVLNEVKNLKIDDILIMKSLNIKLTEENIKTFGKVVSSEYSILPEVENTAYAIKENISGNISNKPENINIRSNNGFENVNGGLETKEISSDEEFLIRDVNKSINSNAKILSDDNNRNYTNENQINGNVRNLTNENEINNNNKVLIQEKNISSSDNSVTKETLIYKEGIINDIGNLNSEALDERTIGIIEEGEKPSLDKVIAHDMKEELDSSKASEEKNLGDISEKKLEASTSKKPEAIIDREFTSNIVKDEIKEKVSLLKSNLMEMLKLSEKEPSLFAKVAVSLESKFQEFKMFNTINNDYYYLNVPMDVNNKEYGCKLIIKDERGKGKKIDSENIKLAASVVTVNMNKVDAFLTVNDRVGSIEIESDKAYVKILEKFKGDLFKDLDGSKYSFNISIKEKKQEFSLSNCRSFFEDDDFTTINTRV